MISVCFQGKPFSIMVIQFYAPTSNAEENLQDLLELTPKKKEKDILFHHRGLEYKSRKSRNTWSNSKFALGVQNEAGKSPPEFCLENALVRANTLFQKHKRRLYKWTSLDGHY